MSSNKAFKVMVKREKLSQPPSPTNQHQKSKLKNPVEYIKREPGLAAEPKKTSSQSKEKPPQKIDSLKQVVSEKQAVVLSPKEAESKSSSQKTAKHRASARHIPAPSKSAEEIPLPKKQADSIEHPNKAEPEFTNNASTEIDPSSSKTNFAAKYSKEFLSQFYVTPPSNVPDENAATPNINNIKNPMFGNDKEKLEKSQILGKKTAINYTPGILNDFDNSFDSTFSNQQISTPTNPKKRTSEGGKSLGKAKRRVNYALVEGSPGSLDMQNNIEDTGSGQINDQSVGSQPEIFEEAPPSQSRKPSKKHIDHRSNDVNVKKESALPGPITKVPAFQTNGTSLCTPLAEEKFNSLLEQLAEDIGLSTEFLIDTSLMKLDKWSAMGFELSEKHSQLTKKVIKIRCKLIQRFEILNNVMNLHASSLENHGEYLEKRISKLTSFGNEIVEEIRN